MNEKEFIEKVKEYVGNEFVKYVQEDLIREVKSHARFNRGTDLNERVQTILTIVLCEHLADFAKQYTLANNNLENIKMVIKDIIVEDDKIPLPKDFNYFNTGV